MLWHLHISVIFFPALITSLLGPAPHPGTQEPFNRPLSILIPSQRTHSGPDTQCNQRALRRGSSGTSPSRQGRPRPAARALPLLTQPRTQLQSRYPTHPPPRHCPRPARAPGGQRPLCSPHPECDSSGLHRAGLMTRASRRVGPDPCAPAGTHPPQPSRRPQAGPRVAGPFAPPL